MSGSTGRKMLHVRGKYTGTSHLLPHGMLVHIECHRMKTQTCENYHRNICSRYHDVRCKTSGGTLSRFFAFIGSHFSFAVALNVTVISNSIHLSLSLSLHLVCETDHIRSKAEKVESLSTINRVLFQVSG
jgi:hypothetical protein